MADEPTEDINQEDELEETGAGETALEDEADAQDAAQSQDNAERASLEEFKQTGAAAISGTKPELEVILDIPVTISMEVGKTEISIRNLLQLNQGSVIELERLADEPLDVMVNGTLIAHGEVVVVNDKFGIRLTDVVSPSERIHKLKH